MAALFALIGRMAVVRGAFNEEQEKAFDNGFQIAIQALMNTCVNNAINNMLDDS